MCCMRQCRRPTSDGRKKVSDQVRFYQGSADCLRESPHESSQPARQLVEATSAALRDPFPELVVGSGSLFWPNAHNRKSAHRPRYHHDKDQNALHSRSQCTLHPYLHGSLDCSWLDEVIGHHGSRRLLVDRREVVIASEVVVDGREILAGVSFPHREAIQLFRSIG